MSQATQSWVRDPPTSLTGSLLACFGMPWLNSMNLTVWLIVGCSLLAVAGCSEQGTSPQKQPNIEVLKKRPLKSRLFLEGEEEVTLRINGRDFHKVRGVAPFYAKAKEINMIYFVTDGPSHKSICYLYDLTTGEAIEIKTDLTELGYEIGQLGERREVIESASTGTVKVARFHGDRKTVYSLDLVRRRISDMQILEIGGGTNTAPRNDPEIKK